jgi:cystathionine beta-lyase/cystathionine gamma-synthase
MNPQAAEQFMERAQNKHGFGLLAVSLGYFETLLSLSGTSTSSELTEEEQKVAGIEPDADSKSHVRLSLTQQRCCIIPLQAE